MINYCDFRRATLRSYLLNFHGTEYILWNDNAGADVKESNDEQSGGGSFSRKISFCVWKMEIFLKRLKKNINIIFHFSMPYTRE